MEIFKRFARYLLREEIAKYSENLQTINRNLQEFKDSNKFLEYMAFGKDYCVIPQSVYNAIVDMLPPPNDFMQGKITKEDLFKRRCKVTVSSEDCYKMIETEIKIVGTKKKENDKEVGLVFYLTDFSKEIFIPISTTSMGGSRASLNLFTWDIYRSGVKVCSNKDFESALLFFNAINMKK